MPDPVLYTFLTFSHLHHIIPLQSRCSYSQFTVEETKAQRDVNEDKQMLRSCDHILCFFSELQAVVSQQYGAIKSTLLMVGEAGPFRGCQENKMGEEPWESTPDRLTSEIVGVKPGARSPAGSADCHVFTSQTNFMDSPSPTEQKLGSLYLCSWSKQSICGCYSSLTFHGAHLSCTQ